MLEVRDLKKNFGTVEAVAGVSFRVEPGKITGYLGPNGAGKSTTVKLISGLLKPTAGEVLVCGHNMATHPVEAKRHLGYVPDAMGMYATLTPNEYLSLVAELYHLDREPAAERMQRLLEAFDVAEAGNRQIESLSKGMRQKVLLISALLHDPDVLLLDEPLSGLDVNAAHTLRQILATQLERGKCILFCSHILDVVERICDRVIVLNDGKVIADDTTSNLLAGDAEGTLEHVFQALTRSHEASETVTAFLSAFESAPAPKAGE